MTQRPVEVAGGQVPLLPTPLTSCPFTWLSQWWWIEYQIDLAAKQLQDENWQLYRYHRKQMEMTWMLKDHLRYCIDKGLYCRHSEGYVYAFVPR